MKKLITLTIATFMVLSMIPAMAFSVSAEPISVEYPEPSPDFWSVWRDPSEYDLEEGEPYMPAGGYEYTSEGFKVTGPDFGEYGTKLNVQTSQTVDLQDGFFMEVVIDNFSYKGESGNCDEWISFVISDERHVGAGGTSYSNNWLCLIRGTGDGNPSNTSHITIRDTNEKPGSFAAGGLGSFAECKPEMRDGKEVYTFEVSWDGSAYTLKVNGCAVSGDGGKISEHILSMERTYVSIVLHSTQKGGKADLTITKQGTSAADADVPAGTDSREPEENMLVYGDLIDPSTVEQNKPALVLDANKTSIKDDPTGSNMTLTPTGSGAYHVQATGEVPYFMWDIKNELTYNAQDFPIVVMMLKDFIGNDGGAYYCSGDVIGATDAYMQGWSQWDDSARFYGEKEDYTYIIMDFSAMIEANPELQGRFHQIRPHFGIDPNDEEMSQWNIEFMACFRSIEEAQAYGDWYNENVIVPADEADTSEDETEPETVDETDAETKADETEAETKADESKADETKADETKGDDAAAEGCASVVGFGAVAVLAAAAAAVVLKKKD